MGNPDSASLIRNSTDRQAMGSAASTATTTQPEFTARGAGRAFTGSESETAACPATATQKVGGKRAKEGESREEGEKREGREKGWSGEQASQERDAAPLGPQQTLVVLAISACKGTVL